MRKEGIYMLRNLKGLAGLVAVSTLLIASAAPARVAMAQSVSGRAYGAYVQTPVVSQSQTPLAVLPSVAPGDGQMAEASGDQLYLAGTLSSEMLTSLTTGATGAGKASAQSVATVADVSILSGLITASRVIGVATSTKVGSATVSNALGSAFEGLSVNGVSVGDTPAPNTQISLPGVGYVVLNEQIQSASGITVNMIHVVLQTVTGGGCTLLGCLPSVTTTVGEIIVGSATSRVGS